MNENIENVDYQEINKFSQQAKSWWDETGDSAPLHIINPIRLQFIQKKCGNSLEQSKILDVGCGGGILTESLAKNLADVSGIDMNKKLIEIAKLHAKMNKLNINYECISTMEYAKKHAQQFDIITCMELLEHVPNPKAMLKDIATLLKPDGKLFISTINRNLQSYLGAVIGAEYLFKLLPIGTHDYQKFIKPSELAAWAREQQLKLFSIKGIDFKPIKKTAELSDAVNINYIAGFIKDC
ncbi:MAG: bifunctional 2-polyprenyl-6-hydroxyphenol methylase/3-demethylubiquinol 3-O-methyltransferase UbiG [Pseudomonadota bacterium]